MPDGLALQPGDVVQIPFGPRDTVGVVWELRPSNASASNLKSVAGLIPAPRLSAELRRFVDWVARYTLAPRGAVLRMTIAAAGCRPCRAHSRSACASQGRRQRRVTPARARVIAAAAGRAGVSQARAGRGGRRRLPPVIDGLIDEGTLEAVGIAPPRHRAPARPRPCRSPRWKTRRRRLLRGLVRGRWRHKRSRVSLLEGVTGSGKTEVYFEAVAEAVRQGRQSIILMPEIALTGQFLERFERQFGVRPAEWHSGIAGRRRERTFAASPRARRWSWPGARSALFLPVPAISG